MSSAQDGRVCPRCGAPADAADRCADCGLDLATLPELPTRSEWEAQRPPTPSSFQPAKAPAAIRPLLHPTERSRFALAIFGMLLALLVLIGVAVGAAQAGFLGKLILGVLFTVAATWFGQQLLRARLLGRSVKVGVDTMPELKALIDGVTATLDYHKRIDVYVIDKARAPIAMSSYLGTRIILIEGDLIAELLKPGRSAQLTFLIGCSIGGLRAKHHRFDLLVVVLQSIDALKYVSLFLRPWYRATIYSGDQIGMACCSDLDAALEATRRLLVGSQLALDLPAGNVLPQACLVQRNLLPRLVQLLDAEPHVTNRYANLICFARYHDPMLWERVRTAMPAEHVDALDRLWERSPYRRRVTGSVAGALGQVATR
jgi:hypothetical protein